MPEPENNATIGMRTPEEITDRLAVLAKIERELLRHPPAPNVDNALRQVRHKVSILRWVLDDVPVFDTLKEKTND